MTKPKGDKLPNYRLLFNERMIREKRYDEYCATITRLMAERGETRLKVLPEAMRIMGYTSVEEERQKHEEFYSGIHEREEKLEAQKEKRLARQEEKQLRWEEALSMLPANARPAVELDWVRAHPAMSRFYRQTNKEEFILVTGDDLMKADHGACPSRSAANMLQHWVNVPAKFYEQMVGEHKKSKDGSEQTGTKGAEADADFEEIQNLLDSIN